MTIFGRWVRKRIEKWLDRYYEGPQPPTRLWRYVADFSLTYPQATRRQWIQFAIKLAEESYRSGFVRGFEHAERDDQPPEVDPDVIADATMPGWRDKPMSAIRDEDFDAEVLDVRNEAADIEQHLSEIHRG